jgi:hypothetical protein
MRHLLKLLAMVWLLLCLVIAAVCLIEKLPATYFRASLNTPVHLWGPWSVRASYTSWWEISFNILHDLPAPNVGPRMVFVNRRLEYTPEALAWEEKLPYDEFHGGSGFDYDRVSNFEINANRNMVLRGNEYIMRMPAWAALLMWLPLALPVLKWWNRMRKVREGLCPNCGYDLRATPSRCPECGKVAETTILAGRAQI